MCTAELHLLTFVSHAIIFSAWISSPWGWCRNANVSALGRSMTCCTVAISKEPHLHQTWRRRADSEGSRSNIWVVMATNCDRGWGWHKDDCDQARHLKSRQVFTLLYPSPIALIVQVDHVARWFLPLDQSVSWFKVRKIFCGEMILCSRCCKAQ